MTSTTVLRAGQRFGKLVVLGETKVVNQRRQYLCKCDCGGEKFIRGDQLKNGKSKSCCERWTNAIQHGMKKTRFYHIWENIKQRCGNPKNNHWQWYGARGIKVCERWQSFTNFKNDMLASYMQHLEQYGERETEIDRIDNDKGYELSNCRWVTNLEQARNKRKLP